MLVAILIDAIINSTVSCQWVYINIHGVGSQNDFHKEKNSLKVRFVIFYMSDFEKYTKYQGRQCVPCYWFKFSNTQLYHHHHHHVVPWPSLATSPNQSSPLASLQVYIPCPHIAAVCMFELVVLLLLGHMRGSIGIHHLWDRPCFSSSFLHVWFV